MLPQAEALLVKVFVLKGGKTPPLRRFFGHAPPIYLILSSPLRQMPQRVEKRDYSLKL